MERMTYYGESGEPKVKEKFLKDSHEEMIKRLAKFEDKQEKEGVEPQKTHYFVSIYTNTDGDFSYKKVDELEYRGAGEDGTQIGNFATLKDAVSVCKKQFQMMIDTISATDWRKERLVEHFRKVLDRLDEINGNHKYSKIEWDNGNQYGHLRIVAHEHENWLKTLEEYRKKAREINEAVSAFGYYCAIGESVYQ